jgi:hypothetical protein
MFLVLVAIIHFEVLNNNVLICAYSLINMHYVWYQLKNISFTIVITHYYTAENDLLILPKCKVHVEIYT